MKAPLVKSYNGAHYFVVTVASSSEKCSRCSKLSEDDCTEHTQPLPMEHQCGQSPVMYVRATVRGIADYMARRME
jgi:hypothetical protein